ncbi:MAG: glucodextranase DOMON-like domain-containing protein [Bacillota bacterium]
MRRFLLGLVIFVWLGALAAAGREEGNFRMEDPPGDDFGPGTYLYPKNKVFAPYHGHFDLCSFSVSTVGDEVHFDATMGLLANPWQAPEGFSHQIIEVYICRGKNGRTEPPVPGASVRFAPEYPWDVRLKAVPWEASELLFLRPDGRPVKHPLRVGLAGPRTIRMAVPLSLLGLPRPAWCYYVLVGSYDGFAEDNFRPVMAKPGEWHFGGGRDDAWDPNVIDLLAPPRGRCSQEHQLGSFDAARGEYAVLFPVGPRCRTERDVPWLPMTLLVLLLVFGWLLWYAPAAWRERARVLWSEAWSRLRACFGRRPKRGR